LFFPDFSVCLEKRYGGQAMETLDTELLREIVQSTDSSLVLFFVVIAVIAVPVCYFLHKNSRHRHAVECSRREQDNKRELNLIQVITSNTAIMEGLKTTLDNNNAALSKTIERIHTRIDNQNDTLQLIFAAINKMTRNNGKGRV
jgi:hypothetical protein